MPHNTREVREDRWVTAISSRLHGLCGSCCRVMLAEPCWPCRLASRADPSRLALADPAHDRLRQQRGRPPVLAVAPGAALAGVVFLASAGSADHGLILTGRTPAEA